MTRNKVELKGLWGIASTWFHHMKSWRKTKCCMWGFFGKTTCTLYHLVYPFKAITRTRSNLYFSIDYLTMNIRRKYELKVVLTFDLTVVGEHFRLTLITVLTLGRYFVTYTLFSCCYCCCGVRIRGYCRAGVIFVRTECKIGRIGTGTRTWRSGRTLGTIASRKSRRALSTILSRLTGRALGTIISRCSFGAWNLTYVSYLKGMNKV